jgi:pyrrolidone-carboxylate peptidase
MLGRLLTGFEPFGGEGDIPSWRLAQALHGDTMAGLPVRLPGGTVA